MADSRVAPESREREDSSDVEDRPDEASDRGLRDEQGHEESTIPDGKLSTYFCEGKPSTYLGTEHPRQEGDAKLNRGDDDGFARRRSWRARRMSALPPLQLRQDAECMATFTHEWLAQFSTAQKVGLILGPLIAIVASSVEISDEYPKANDALGITLFIVCWWVFEVIPIAITSLLPLLLYPLASVQRGRIIASQYYNFVSFLFIGAFLVVVAVEKVGAHKRFALWALKFFGTNPRIVLFGFMLITGVVSMFASNTSTTILMLPVVKGFLEGRTASPDGKRFEKAALLGIAFSATSGGTGTVIGTVPNLVFSLLFSDTFPSGPSVNFQSWMAFALPIALIMIVSAWAILCLIFLRGIQLDLNAEVLRRESEALGPIIRDEKIIALVLAIMILLWLIRPYVIDPYLGFCDGDEFIGTEAACEAITGYAWETYIDDGTIACFGAVSLFFIPSSTTRGAMLLDESALNHLPYGVILLLGAGFAISNAVSNSGLSIVIGSLIVDVVGLSPLAIVAVVTVVIGILTELISNTATITLFLPILFDLAIQQEINPMLLGLPATVAASLGFLLPTATPPAAIAFATGKLSFYDMAKGGFFVKLVGMALTIAFTFLTGSTFTNLDTFPAWAIQT
ncbi:Solute carrier family 13 member 5 [Hondaea fermentalgiana]|uniref:Solute carrier family 13 member 5 n=1 Tax=Hondaea fermentalgiana TaxID=2315210 RepID=A0A2R5GIC5_9STRA|nr:Solute carrier family 13 member 5 [Hondaea fermentalgiana]|eukprot:GBG30642.1 Solute carrier family 13 member 5 [Hondaea fermentalgiana]